MNRYAVIFLILCTMVSAFLMNAINGISASTTFEKEIAAGYDGSGNGYIATALRLLEAGEFSDETHSFFGAVPTGPVYAIFIAGAFLLFGKSLWAIWILQMIAFALAVILLYKFSSYFFTGMWAIAPAFLFALFWGASLFVFHLNNEIIGLLCVTGFMVAMFYYAETSRIRHLLTAALCVSLLILIKPIFEYFIVPMLVVVAWSALYRSRAYTQAARHAGVFLGVCVLLVGTWHVRNYRVLDSYTVSTGGHAFLIRATSATYPQDTMTGFFLSTMLGDLIAGEVVPGYAERAEPANTIREIFNKRRVEMKAAGLSEVDVDKIFWAEAVDIARTHPTALVLTTPAWLFRLNSPPRHDGGMLEHLFVGTYPGMPLWLKIAIILGIRTVWYGFIAIALWWIFREMVRCGDYVQSVVFWSIGLLVLYTNALYAGFAHAEVRYALPLMPIYIFFFVLGLHDLWISRTKKPIMN
ncbi:MAG: hypothetical protein A2756_00325 [Candidatus Ryanbacteria bacterium RIFCSPHIGHO2_01_FULL_48_27]|uniref:Glycosyltransferase RgtA/B/C/D-like domain-containing protein n=1 Tax=Candidatus Ryanbacteria bacterium RIFCSPHIGHO2_01_FULL_48_27 TaxID=1802115 RepID=A0A1G2G652_9BACT|nr:MAG: hypothetical protein A2756_00325 [Candidatus Ryanbacteria bacterium RIFCSPHIGHO2_01_FULL_48_27]